MVGEQRGGPPCASFLKIRASPLSPTITLPLLGGEWVIWWWWSRLVDSATTSQPPRNYFHTALYCSSYWFPSHEIQGPASASPARSCWRLHAARARRRQRHRTKRRAIRRTTHAQYHTHTHTHTHKDTHMHTHARTHANSPTRPRSRGTWRVIDEELGV